MSESKAGETKEPFFRMSSIPGANILVPAVGMPAQHACFPVCSRRWKLQTFGMTQQGASPLVGAFLLVVGTTISFKSAPAAAARGAIIIAVKQVVVIAVSLLILYVFDDNLFGISAYGDARRLHRREQRDVRRSHGYHGQRGRARRRGHHHADRRPSGDHDRAGAAGQAPIGWSLVGAVLPIVVGIILGNVFPSFRKMMAPALSGIIVLCSSPWVRL